jgi:hypothetical protein
VLNGDSSTIGLDNGDGLKGPGNAPTLALSLGEDKLIVESGVTLVGELDDAAEATDGSDSS